MKDEKNKTFLHDTEMPFLKYRFKWLVQVDYLNDIYSMLVPKFHDFSVKD